jgi:hypothetical protein
LNSISKYEIDYTKSKMKWNSTYGFGLAMGEFTEFEGPVLFAGGEGVAGIPHIFDSVELTNFRRGLLGLQKLFFSSALIC